MSKKKAFHFTLFSAIQILLRIFSSFIYLNWINSCNNANEINSYVMFLYLSSLTLNIFTYGTYSVRYIDKNLIWSIGGSGYASWISIVSVCLSIFLFVFDFIEATYILLFFFNFFIYEITIIKIKEAKLFDTQILINSQFVILSLTLLINIFFNIPIVYILYLLYILLLIYFRRAAQLLIFELFCKGLQFNRLLVFVVQFKSYLLNNLIGLFSWSLIPLFFRYLNADKYSFLVDYETLLKIMVLFYTISTISFTQLFLSNLLNGKRLLIFSSVYLIILTPLFFLFSNDLFYIFSYFKVVGGSDIVRNYIPFVLTFGNILILLNLQRTIVIKHNIVYKLNIIDSTTLVTLLLFSVSYHFKIKYFLTGSLIFLCFTTLYFNGRLYRRI